MNAPLSLPARIVVATVALVVCLQAPGCGVILREKQHVRFTCGAPGAQFFVDGRRCGNQEALATGKDHVVRCEAPGFQPQTKPISGRGRLSGMTLVMDCLWILAYGAGIVFIIVDIAQGTMWELAPSEVDFHLQADPDAPADLAQAPPNPLGEPWRPQRPAQPSPQREPEPPPNPLGQPQREPEPRRPAPPDPLGQPQREPEPRRPAPPDPLGQPQREPGPRRPAQPDPLGQPQREPEPQRPAPPNPLGQPQREPEPRRPAPPNPLGQPQREPEPRRPAQPNPLGQPQREPEPTPAPAPGRRLAVVVGVSSFADPSLPPRPGAAEDARAVSAALAGNGVDVQATLIDAAASRAAVLGALSALERAELDQDDAVLLVVIGRGLGDARGEPALAAADTALARPAETLLQGAVLAEYLDRTGAGHSVVLADPGAPGGRAAFDPARLAAAGDAARLSVLALAPADGREGARAMVSAIGRDADGDGAVGWGEVAAPGTWGFARLADAARRGTSALLRGRR